MRKVIDEKRDSLKTSVRKPLMVRFVPRKFTPLPTGKYNLKLIGITDNEKGCAGHDIFVFEFEVIEGSFKDAFIYGFVNNSREGESVKGKLWKWVSALTGRKPCEYDAFDLNDLIGCECVADIERVAEHKNKITALYPPEKRRE